jgi:ParB/RepB/Spo0J family partition protein
MTTTFAEVPLAEIVASPTNPRKTFDPAKLAELAESIRATGVHTPVLLRPLPAAMVAETAHMRPRPIYELVSGERRVRASEQAQARTIPAIVRALTDSEVLDIQLIENLQRDDLLPLEEAEGYDRLMTSHEPPLTAAQIGERIGKSRSYVYNRLKLLDLGPEGREALRNGLIQTAHAERLARLADTKVQAQALANIYNPMTGEAMSVRAASDLIQRQYMLKLSEAKFDKEDTTLVALAPPCSKCENRTDHDPDLFADAKGTVLCLDMACFRKKETAHQERQLKAARESGATVIEGREARELMPPTADGRIEGYLRLDDPRDAPAGGKTLRQLIGQLLTDEGLSATMIANPAKDGDLIAVVDTATATRLLALKSHQDKGDALQAKAATSAKAAAELQKQKDKDRFEHAWRWALMKATWEKINKIEPGMYNVSAETIRCLARDHIPAQPKKAEPLADFLGLGKVGPVPALVDWVNDHPRPEEALALLIMFEATHSWQGSPTGGNLVKALTVATDQLLGIDPESIKAAVEAEHKAEIKARKASLPLDPAAQANGARGAEAKGTKGKTGAKGKGKKPPAAPAVPKVSAEEAMQGIAAAMQGQEAGADCGPEGADPAGCAGGDDGRATSPDAGAAPMVPGERDGFVSETEWPFPGAAA